MRVRIREFKTLPHEPVVWEGEVKGVFLSTKPYLPRVSMILHNPSGAISITFLEPINIELREGEKLWVFVK